MKILITVGKEHTQRNDVQDALRCASSIADALGLAGHGTEIFFVEEPDFESPDQLTSRIRALHPDCVFNLFEGFAKSSQSEIVFAEMLESLAIPYTGNSGRTLRLCLSKETAKEVLREHSVPVPAGVCIKDITDVGAVRLRYPLFLKPCCEDASVGIDEDSLVRGEHEFFSAVLKKLDRFPHGVIVEEFLSGAEYNVGCLGTFPFEILGVSVMDYSLHPDVPPFMTYSAKWETEAHEYKALIPSPETAIEPGFRRSIVEIAARTGQALGCKSYFRVDMRAYNGKLFVIDVNPNPDINSDSGFMRQAYHKGYTYGDVLEKIVMLSASRAGHPGV